MAFQDSAGNEFNSEHERDLAQGMLGGPAGGKSNANMGSFSGADWARLKVIAPVVGVIVAYVLGIFGLLVQARRILNEFYLINPPTSKLFFASVILAIVIGFLMIKFVLIPLKDKKFTVWRLVLALVVGLGLVAGLFTPAFDTIGWSQFERTNRWQRSFFGFWRAEANADQIVIRVAPATDAEAVLTLEQGEEFLIAGDAGSGWYFGRERDTSDGNNFGYIQADSVTLNTPDAKIKAMRPAVLIADNASMHRARRWQSRQLDTANKDDYVLAVGKSSGGWTPVIHASTKGWMVGYMNDALLFFDNGTGAKAPSEPKGIRERTLENDVPLYLWGNERNRYAEMNVADKDYYRRNFPADRVVIIPKGERVIFLDKETDRQMAPAVYNGRMGWYGWLDYQNRYSISGVAE